MADNSELDQLPVIGSSEAQADLAPRPAKEAKKPDQQYQVRIDLPSPPAPSLVRPSAAANEEGSLAIIITCVASETLQDLKSLVLEMDGFWLGAFQFVKVTPEGGEASGEPAGSDLLNEWSDVGTVFHEPEYEDPSVLRILKVVEVPYSENEARSHVVRARDLFNNALPSLAARQVPRAPAYDPNSLAIDGGITLFASLRDSVITDSSAQADGDVEPSKKAKDASAPKKGAKRSKSSLKPHTNGVTPEAKAQLTNGRSDSPPASMAHAFTNWLPKDAPSNPTLPYIQKRQQLAEQAPSPTCVKTFGLSPWNPPPQNLRMRGHLLYLSLTTLEGDYLHITASNAGFFVDKSDNAHFDPSPRSSKTNAERVYSSLFALLADLSPRFIVALREMSEPVGPIHPDTFSSAAIQNCTPASPWLVSPPPPTADPIRSQLVYLATGAQTAEALPSSRDWNEELLMIRELPRSTVQERLYRERLLAKAHSDLAQAATRAVIGIIHGDILPANPQEPAAMHTVVHQHMLLIPARDATDQFAHQGGEEAVRHSVAKDVLGARILNSLDIPGVNLTPTVVVDYLGQRWVAQPILPGILGTGKAEDDKKEDKKPAEDAENDAETQTTPPAKTKSLKEGELAPGFRVVYGGADADHPEKSYVADPDFQEIAKKVANHLLLAQHDVHDVEGKATALWLSGDVKGVIGQDGNKYLIDLYRLQPMDINFKENDLDGDLYHNPHEKAEDLPKYDSGDVRYPHRFLLLRPELLEAYKDVELRSWIYQQVAESNARKEAEAKARLESIVRRENESEEQATRRAGIEALVESLHQPQTIININDFEMAFNPDAFVDRKDPAGGQPPNEDEPSTKAVREASNYLRKHLIANFLGDCINNGTVPADGFALTKLLHQRGLNLRYLGLLASHATVDRLEVPPKHLDFAQQSLKVLLAAFEREMVVRGAKHVLRRLLHGRDLAEIAPCISHFLNCLVGTSFNSRPAPDTSSLVPTTRERPWTKLTPDSLQHSILLEIARRYRYNLNPALFSRLRKPQLLREVCLRNGIQLQVRDFQFEAADTTDSDPQAPAKRAKKTLKAPVRERLTTFEPEDIAHVHPISKEILHKSSLADELFEQGSQQIGQGNIAVGEGLVSDAINYYEQIFGSVHPELANRYHELAVSYHQLSQPLIRNISAYETSKEATTTEARQKAKADTTLESDEMLESAKRELRGFVESAVQMNRQSIIVAERTLGVDHHTTAQQYVDLAILEHANGDVHLGLKLCRHAIELLEQIYGPNHPEATRAATNAAQMVVQWQNHAAAVPIFQAAVDMNTAARGPTAVSTGMALSQLANALALAGDLHKSQEIARQTTELYAARLGKQDEKTVEAENLYDILTKAILNKERGEQAKLGRLARRLGLNEERAKQLLDRTNSKTRSKANATSETSSSPQSNLAAMPLQELVQFIEQGPSKDKGKGRSY